MIRRVALVVALFAVVSPAAAVPANISYATDPPYSAVCDNQTDDYAPLQNAINSLVNSGGGMLIVPRACKTSATLFVTGRVVIQGLGAGISSIQAIGDIDVIHFTQNLDWAGLEKISVFGYINPSSVHHAVLVDNNAVVNFRDCRVWAGYSGLLDAGADGIRENCFFGSSSASGASVISNGANWWVRVKIDDIGFPVQWAFLQGTPAPGMRTTENHFVQSDF